MTKVITQYQITDRAAGNTMRWTKPQEHIAFRHSNLEYEFSGWQDKLPKQDDEMIDDRPSSIRRFVVTKCSESGANTTGTQKFFYGFCKLVEILRKPDEPQGYDY